MYTSSCVHSVFKHSTDSERHRISSSAAADKTCFRSRGAHGPPDSKVGHTRRKFPAKCSNIPRPRTPSSVIIAQKKGERKSFFAFFSHFAENFTVKVSRRFSDLFVHYAQFHKAPLTQPRVTPIFSFFCGECVLRQSLLLRQRRERRILSHAGQKRRIYCRRAS